MPFNFDVPEPVRARFKAAVAIEKPKTSMKCVLVEFMKKFGDDRLPKISKG